MKNRLIIITLAIVLSAGAGCAHTRFEKTADGYNITRTTFLTNQALTGFKIDAAGTVQLGTASSAPADVAAAVTTAAIKAVIK